MSPRRGLLSIVGALIAATVFALTARVLPAPPISDLGAIEVWWQTNGTTVAALSLMRVAGLVLSGYVALLGSLATIASLTRWNWAEALWRRCASPAIRRVLAGGGLVASLSIPSVGAADTGPAPTTFELADTGPAPTTFELADTGPAPTTPDRVERAATAGHEGNGATPPAAPEPNDTGEQSTSTPQPAPADTWVVARGDHLWAIASETVADRGREPDDLVVGDYWRRLIEHNRDVIGEDPDLIHPGQVIELPE